MDIDVVHGDITQVKTEAIVNAAKPSLMGGGGVDGAIHRAGGPKILEECIVLNNKYGPCGTGEAVITSGGNLPAKYVIHTVGPVWRGGDSGEASLLQSCYINSINLAEKYHVKSIAFPNISTGVYGYPRHKAAEIAVHTVRGIRSKHIENLLFVCFDEENFKIYNQLLS